ncbi:MAG: RNA polymerase sigma factor [Candidatus Dormibacteria bacterium]
MEAAVQRLEPRDVEYMEDLFRVYAHAVRNLCLGRLRDPVAADDVVQEVFRRAATHIEKLREDPLPWLLVVGTRLCVSELRHRGRVGGGIEVELELHQFDQIRDPEDEVLSTMTVADLLSCLTKAERRVVEAKCIGDMTHLEAGRHLGLSSGTTRQLMARARRRLLAYVSDRDMSGNGFWGVVGASARGRWMWVRERLHAASRVGPDLDRFLGGAWPLVVAVAVGLALMPGGRPVDPHGGSAQSSGLPRLEAEASYRLAPAALPPVSAPGRTSGGVPARSPGATPSHPSPNPGLASLFTPHSTRPQDVNVSDLQGSPDFSSDHTTIAVGADTQCGGLQPCNQSLNQFNTSLLWSRDGGATWLVMVAAPPAGTAHLLLPPQSIGAGNFFGYTGQGRLYSFTNWGASNQLVLAGYGNFGLASTAGGDVVTLSNTTLWGVGGPAPTLLATFPAGATSAGPSVYVPGRNLYLQPAFHGAPTLGTTEILSCGTACLPAPPDLGWNATTSLLASPDVATDGLVLAWSNSGLAVSRDSGATFASTAVLAPAGQIQYVALVRHRSSYRLVAAYGTGQNAAAIAYSDDLGAHWAQGLPPGGALAFKQIASLGSDQLIASATLPGTPTAFGFFCSYDGAATWGACAAP